MNKQSSISYIPNWAKASRKIFNLLTGYFLPCDIVDDNNILTRAEKDVSDGMGLLIVFTHFSYRDPVDLVRSLIFTNPVLKNRELINPISFHQYNNSIKLLAFILHSWCSPIVNQDTLKRNGFIHMKKGGGLQTFIEKSSKVLSCGGIVTMAVNAGRREYIDFEDIQRPAGYFILSTQTKGVTQYGILLVSFSMKDAKNYTKKEVGGINLGKKYSLTPAGYYRLNELLAKPEVGNKVSNIDSFIRKKLAAVVPKEYLPKGYQRPVLN